MNPKLIKEVATYSGIAGMIAATGSANGQVVYVDISPDDTVGHQRATPFTQFGDRILDLNNDGQNDFFFGDSYFSGGPCAGYSSIDTYMAFGTFAIKHHTTNNAVAIQGIGACISWKKTIKSLNPNDLISNNLPFLQDLGMVRSFHDPCYAPNCLGGNPIGTEKYIGLRFAVGANTHFAWLRYKVTNDMAMVLKDYAYESAPGVPIRAGDTISLNTSVEEYLPNVTIFVSGNAVTVQSGLTFGEGNIIVYDLAGRQTLSVPFDSKEIRFELNTPGIYFLELINDNGTIFRKKFFVN